MENEKNESVAKKVLFVFGIIFSIILVPGLILGIPAGGAVTSITKAASLESIESTIKEVKLSEKLYELILDELFADEGRVEELNQDFWKGLVQDSITLDTVDEVITEVIACMYNGTEPEIDLSGMIDSFKNGIDEIRKNGFQDMYSVWTEGTQSSYFSSGFVQSFWEEIENRLLSDYSEYGADSYDELEALYDSQHGDGAFSELLDEKMSTFKESWEEEFAINIDKELDEMTEGLEHSVNESVYEAVMEPDVRSLFDSLKEVSVKGDKVKLIVYAIIIGAVLLLLVCYWFKTAGFVVPAVALIFGGLLCKLLTLSESFILRYINETIAKEPELAEMGKVMSDIFRGILTPVFDGISKFGTITIGMGVLLVGAAILKGVVTKNMHTAE